MPLSWQAYAEPEKTGLALDALSACSFINIVDAPTLGLILPVLLRGMKERRVRHMTLNTTRAGDSKAGWQGSEYRLIWRRRLTRLASTPVPVP